MINELLEELDELASPFVLEDLYEDLFEHGLDEEDAEILVLNPDLLEALIVIAEEHDEVEILDEGIMSALRRAGHAVKGDYNAAKARIVARDAKRGAAKTRLKGMKAKKAATKAAATTKGRSFMARRKAKRSASMGQAATGARAKTRMKKGPISKGRRKTVRSDVSGKGSQLRGQRLLAKISAKPKRSSPGAMRKKAPRGVSMQRKVASRVANKPVRSLRKASPGGRVRVRSRGGKRKPYVKSRARTLASR